MINRFGWLSLSCTLYVASCSGNPGLADAYGNFEATEITVSAEATGRLLQFEIMEGDSLTHGEQVGLIDTSQLFIQKNILLAQIQTIRTKAANIEPQILVVEEQIRVAEREKKRIEGLLQVDAATTKQLDDISGQIDILNRQISSIRAQKESFLSETTPVQTQIDQLNDQLRRCRIVNPSDGTILGRFVESGEVVSFGKPLYVIADLRSLYLRVFVSGSQLSNIRIGQTASVFIDQATPDTLIGVVEWISSKAEFTPKIIQTREERVNLVYAVKIRVKNDGRLKIGMPGEAVFH